MNSAPLFMGGCVLKKYAQFFQKIFSPPKKFFCQNRKIPSKMDCPPFFTGGVSPKTCAIFPKKIFFFVSPAFCRSRLLSFPPFVAQKFFFQFFLSKSKNSFKNGFPTLFYGGRVLKNMCDFF